MKEEDPPQQFTEAQREETKAWLRGADKRAKEDAKGQATQKAATLRAIRTRRQQLEMEARQKRCSTERREEIKRELQDLKGFEQQECGTGEPNHPSARPSVKELGLATDTPSADEILKAAAIQRVPSRVGQHNGDMRADSQTRAAMREERLKNRWLKLVAIWGDEGKAAGKLGITRAEVERWIANDPSLLARIESEKSSVSNDRALRILFDAKVAPYIGKRRKEKARGRKGKGSTSDILAAWVARSGLSKQRLTILGEAKANNREFFISLGRYLSGDLMVELWDDLDEVIARNWQSLERMKRREATEWLRNNGFSDLTEERFRKRLVNLKLTRGNE